MTSISYSSPQHHLNPSGSCEKDLEGGRGGGDVWLRVHHSLMQNAWTEDNRLVGILYPDSVGHPKCLRSSGIRPFYHDIVISISLLCLLGLGPEESPSRVYHKLHTVRTELRGAGCIIPSCMLRAHTCGVLGRPLLIGPASLEQLQMGGDSLTCGG